LSSLNYFTVNFPQMHPDLTDLDLPGQVLFFDPGFTQETDPEKYFRPGNLPLDPKTAQRYYRDFLDFGTRFKDPTEMAYFAAGNLHDFYRDTGMSIRSDLREAMAGGKKADDLADVLTKAQVTLILAYALEERVKELLNLESGISEAWDKFEDSLGLDEESVEMQGEQFYFAGKTMGLPPGVMQEFGLPWKQVLEAMLVFLPKNAGLVTTGSEIRAALEDSGLSFVEMPSTRYGELFGLGGVKMKRVLFAEAPAWRFLTQKKPPEGQPWLLFEKELFVIEHI